MAPESEDAAGGGPAVADLAAGDREPVHTPGSIQPHGALLVLAGPEHRVVQASANVGEVLGRAPAEVLGRPLAEALGPAAPLVEQSFAAQPVGQAPHYLCTVPLPGGPAGRPFNAVAHTVDDLTLLELEPAANDEQLTFRYLYSLVQCFVERLAGARDVTELSAIVAAEVRRVTGFDRVIVYRFDEHWNGHVIAEDRDAALEPYLGLWFPASDIPRQARDLYRRNRLRLIADARDAPAPLVPPLRPDTGAPLDLSLASLRGVSPAHLEYLAGMGAAATMSVSVLVDGELWGLVSCHHGTPRHPPFDVRAACDLIGQLFAIEVAATEHRDDYEHRIRLKVHEATLLAYMTQEEHFVRGLTGHSDEFLALTDADGAAVLYDGECTLIGATPPEPDVRALVDRLVGQGQEVFSTDALPALLDDGERYRRHASGVLAIPISKLYRSYVLWFRPEVVQTVTWGGNPAEPVADAADPDGPRRHPRKSFAARRETVRGRSRPWLPAHVDAALGLRSAIIGIVLRKAEELAAVSAELARANSELEAFSYSVSHDLRAPFRHIVGYSELLRDRLPADIDPRTRRYIDTIVESAHFAGTLVDNLLAFSQIGRSRLHRVTVPLAELVAKIVRDFDVDSGRRRVRWDVGELPAVVGDPVLLHLAFQNLLGNALKYTRPRDEARIAVTATADDDEVVVAVRDNGVGFDMRYAHKLFGVFQRLHRIEDFEGTGIGLANVRRIAERHGGRAWAEGEPDAGATFYVALPLRHPPTRAESYAEADSAG